jgi:hypothetical protein
LRYLLIAALLSGLCLPAVAQYPGQYPPGQYPPGQYPPGQYPPNTYPGPMGVPLSIPGIHLPKRKPKTDSGAKTTVQSIDGTLRSLAEKDLLLQTSPNKVLRFRLISKTEFRGKDGKPVRDSLIHPGDKLTIDVSPDDVETALHVILIKSGSGSDREAASVPVDDARIAMPDPGDFGKVHSVTETSGGDSPRESAASDDIHDRPTLSRKSDEPDDSPVVSDNKASEDKASDGKVSSKASNNAAVADVDSTNAIIRNARSEAYSFSADLPNFLVQQVTTRYTGTRLLNNWRAMDVVTADVASVDGKEDYRNIKVNGRPTDRPEDSGSWSTGEFQVTLEDILSPRTFAAFTPRGEERIVNRAAWVFDLSVEQSHSHWKLISQNGGEYYPAYRGTIWVDKESRRVLRIEQKAIGLPRDFAYDKAESTLAYGFVDIDGRSYLLPIQSDNVACLAGSLNCGRNAIDFRNYRKFSADSNVKFDQ